MTPRPHFEKNLGHLCTVRKCNLANLLKSAKTCHKVPAQFERKLLIWQYPYEQSFLESLLKTLSADDPANKVVPCSWHQDLHSPITKFNTNTISAIFVLRIMLPTLLRYVGVLQKHFHWWEDWSNLSVIAPIHQNHNSTTHPSTHLLLLGVIHILRNHFWGSRQTPPPLCNL